MRLMRLFVAALAILVVSMLAGSASATPEIGYTLAAPVPFAAGTATGTIDPVAGLFDAEDSICLAGSCDYENQDWLLVTVTVSGGSVNDLGIGASPLTAEGMGYLLVGGEEQDGLDGRLLYTGNMAVPTVPTFTFFDPQDLPDPTLDQGLTGTSLILFIAYANNTLPTDFPVPGAGFTQFMVSEYGGAGLNSPSGAVTEPDVELVPEPSTALLLGGGLLILGVRTRRRRA